MKTYLVTRVFGEKGQSTVMTQKQMESFIESMNAIGAVRNVDYRIRELVSK